jgi:hypothetical protein
MPPRVVGSELELNMKHSCLDVSVLVVPGKAPPAWISVREVEGGQLSRGGLLLVGMWSVAST